MIRRCRRFRVLQCDKCGYWGCFRFQWGVGNDTGPKERTCCWGWMQSSVFDSRSVEFKSGHRNGEMIYKKLQAFVLCISNLFTIHCIFIVFGEEHWSQEHGSWSGPEKSSQVVEPTSFWGLLADSCLLQLRENLRRWVSVVVTPKGFC